MEVKLEVLLSDQTRAGIQSAERNIAGMETQMQEVINILKKELVGLQDAFKNTLSQGISSPSDLADIQALKGKIGELEEELKKLKTQAEVPMKPNIDLGKYLTDEIKAMENAEDRVKAIIANIQQDIDSLRSKSLESAATGVINPKDAAEIKALEAQIRSLTDTLGRYDAAKKESYTTPVIDEQMVTRQTNNLKLQFSQVARELPALAMGPQMFILAISNNLPMLADAVKNVREQNELLAKSGQKSTSVWKQLLSAAGSWQTMLVVGITLLTVYGKEIWEWTKGLFKAKDAILDLSSAENEMALARQKASESIKKEQTELDILYSKLKNTAVTTKERIAATNEWIKRYPEYANILSGENLNLGKLETAYKALSKEIYANAVARHYADKIGELSVKQEKEEIKRLNQKLTVAKAEQEYERLTAEYNKKKEQGFGSATAKLDAANKIELARRNVEEQKKIYNDLIENVNNYGKNITTISNHIQAADLFPQPQEGTYDYWKQQQENAEGVLKEIKSNVKKTLDDAAKDGKDLFSLGIDKSVVETYKKAVSEVNEAKKQLKIYDDKDKKTTGKTPADYQNELSDARVRARQKTEEAFLAVMTDGYLKRKELASKEYKETLADIDKRERDDLKRIATARKKGVKVDPEEENQVKSNAQLQRGLAHQKFYKDYAAIEVDWLSQGTKAWIEYNKQYGTSQQKRLAIAQEYGIKIAQAENPTDKERYRKEMEETLSSFDFDKLKKSMNWELIFGNLGALTRKQLQDVKQQLTAFRNSPEFKQTACPEQIKIIEDALNNINATMVDKSGFFGGLGDALTDYEAKVKAVAAAQEELNKALEAGDEAAIEKAKQNLNQANANKQGSQGNVDKSTDKAVGNLNKVAAAMKQLSSADVSLSEVGGAVENLVSILGESKSKIGGIIAAILSILDTIGDKGITDFVTDLVSNVMSSLRDAAIKDIDKTSFGLLDMSFFKGADYSDYNEMIDQYTRMNEIWDELIDKKKEYIKTSYGEEAEKAGKEAEELVRKSMDSYRTLGLERLNAGASTGSHSIGVRQRKSISKEGWNEARNVLGGDFDKYEIGDGRMTGLFSLSVEQLEKLKYEAPTFWAKLDGDVADYLNKIIEGSEKIAEIQEQVKEQLTQVSFDNVRSSFLDTLMDMDSSAEDFADNFEKYMQRAILDSMMAKSYEDRLQAWYDSFADANSKNEGGKTNISDDEYKKLQEEWDKIVSDALGERDALKELFGWKGEDATSSQSGRSGAFETMTQEQGTKLEGLFTALQDHTSAIHKLLEDLMSGRDADKEIFMQIAENTAYCKFLEQMYEIMERQDRDGMKLKG